MRVFQGETFGSAIYEVAGLATLDDFRKGKNGMSDNEHKPFESGYSGSVSFQSYGMLQTTSQPANAVADLIASNDRYHDNVLTIENRSAFDGTKIAQLDGDGGVISRGAGYRDGVFRYVPLTTTGSGRNAVAHFLVSDGTVRRCDVTDGGQGFSVGDTITVANSHLGGTGSGFSSVVKSLTGNRGNAAIRFRDSVTGYERCAFGYNSLNNQSFYIGEPLLYAEIGNIGPPGDTCDTDFAIVNTHSSHSNHLPGTAYIVFRVKGDTGEVQIASHDRKVWVTFNDSHVARIVGTLAVAPGESATPAHNGDVVFELTDDKTLTFKAKGRDGIVRSASLKLLDGST